MIRCVALCFAVAVCWALLPGLSFAQEDFSDCVYHYRSSCPEELDDLRRCIYAYPFECSVNVLQSDGAISVIGSNTDLTGGCVQPPPIDGGEISLGEDVYEIHTHQLSVFNERAADGWDMTTEQQQAVCDGTRIPPVMSPSAADWKHYIWSATSQGIGFDTLKGVVFDPSGYWVYGVSDPNHPVVKALIENPDNPVIPDGPGAAELLEKAMAFFDTGYAATYTDDPAERMAAINDVQSGASELGLYLQFVPGPHFSGGHPIPDCMPESTEDHTHCSTTAVHDEDEIIFRLEEDEDDEEPPTQVYPPRSRPLWQQH